jgi:catalase
MPEHRSTTDTGAPAISDRNSLTVGPDGPILLHDVHFINQMAHFNRERVPERNVHAKGGGAFGVFKTTENVSRYTKAALFQPGVETESSRGSRPLPASRVAAPTRGGTRAASR